MSIDLVIGTIRHVKLNNNNNNNNNYSILRALWVLCRSMDTNCSQTDRAKNRESLYGHPGVKTPCIFPSSLISEDIPVTCHPYPFAAHEGKRKTLAINPPRISMPQEARLEAYCRRRTVDHRPGVGSHFSHSHSLAPEYFRRDIDVHLCLSILLAVRPFRCVADNPLFPPIPSSSYSLQLPHAPR